MITWQTALITVLTSAGVASLIQLILQKTWFSRIEHRRQTALEAYRHELAALSEKEKFDYQRWMTDFAIYTQKKHGVYSELYKLILVTDGSLEGLIGFRNIPSFEEYSRTDMDNYLRKYQVVEGYIKQLLSGWESNRRKCLEDIREYLYMIDFQKADHARQEAKNYFLVNILYLSSDVEKIINELFSLLVKQYVYERQQLVDHYVNEGSKKELPEIKQRKDILLGELKLQMKNELSVGFYKT